MRAGKFLFVSGRVAIDPGDREIIDGTVAEQAFQIMENMRTTMQTELYALYDVVISYVYLSSIEQFSEFNSICGEYFEQEFPARVTVGIQLMPRALVEISVIAQKE